MEISQSLGVEPGRESKGITPLLYELDVAPVDEIALPLGEFVAIGDAEAIAEDSVLQKIRIPSERVE